MNVKYVWCIEDEKYGLQAVCENKKIATYLIKNNKYHPSGFGSRIYKRRIINNIYKGE